MPLRYSFKINNESQYPVEFVANIIEEYIYRLKGARVRIDPSPILENDTKEIKLFEKTAIYALAAHEGGWRLKNRIR